MDSNYPGQAREPLPADQKVKYGNASETPSGGRRLWRHNELRTMPGAEWLVQGLIEEGTTVVVYGASGTRKSFLMADVGMSVASGIDFHGAPTKQGSVVYVAGEGFHGTPRRVAAWEMEHDIADMPFYVLDGAVSLLDEKDVTRFIEEVRAASLAPTLIIIDTLSRSFTGGDENLQRDMGLLVASVDRLRREFGATIVVIHHTGKDGSQERGSSVLRCDFDAMIQVRANDREHSVTIKCSKARDSERFADMTLSVVEVADSCVLRRTLSESQAKALAALGGDHLVGGLRFNEWAQKSALVDSTLNRAREYLHQQGFVEHDPSTAAYTLSARGRRWLGVHDSAAVVDREEVDDVMSSRDAEAQPQLSQDANATGAASESADTRTALSLQAPPYRGAQAKARRRRPGQHPGMRKRSAANGGTRAEVGQ